MALNSRSYQPAFYQLSRRVRDRESRLGKAEKIGYILTTLFSYRLETATCLDLGCSSGIITNALAPLFAKMIGLEYDEIALKHLDRSAVSQAQFLRGDAMHLPLVDRSIDVIICAQVYEHVPDDRTLVAEMYRVLVPGGLVFFSGPNKLFPLEPHYHLPFLHWLPAELATWYMHAFGRGDRYYERSRTLWDLRRLLAPFQVQDVTVEIFIRQMRLSASGTWVGVIGRLPSPLWEILRPVFPNFNWILHKPLQ